jgi:hypothetical protein
MIPKKPAPDLIRGGSLFSEKIMLKQDAKAKPVQLKLICALDNAGRRRCKARGCKAMRSLA